MTRDLDPRRQQLRDLIDQRSLRRGDFKLASGQASGFFFDMKQTVLHPRGARLCGELLIEALTAACGARPRYVGGLETGAIPVMSAVVLACAYEGEDAPPIDGFFVRKQAKGTGTNVLIDGIVADDGPIAVLEDVTTTGGSALRAVEALRGAGHRVAVVATIVDRLAGAADALREHELELVSLLDRDDFAA
ncbi:MAG: orotate phosphoribosyltransferase [Myxococcales bacterium]|nr:orotate phosphoribosyltransferase [Myxococcales bacterium]